MRPLRLGLIGAGRWSRAYLKTVASLPGAEIVRVARRQARPLDPPFQALEVTTDWRRVAEATDLDGVLLATPPGFHAEPALAALRAGLPVLIEKPMTLRVPEARAILEAARAARVPAWVEHTHLFHAAFRAIRERTSGRTLTITSRAGNRGTFHHDYSSLWDWGAHDVAMTLALTGEAPQRVAARRLAHEDTPEGSGDLFQLDLTFAPGHCAQLTFGNILPARVRRFLVDTGTERWLYDDWCPPRLFQAPPAYTVQDDPVPACTPQPCAETLPLTTALTEFCAAIRAGRHDTHSVELGLLVVEVLAEAERQVGATA